MQLEEQLLQQEFELDEQCHQQIMQLQQVRIIDFTEIYWMYIYI